MHNQQILGEYYQALDTGHLPTLRGVELTIDDQLRRSVIVQLMCNFVLHKARVEAQYGIVFDDYFADALRQLEPLAADGLLHLEQDKVTVTTAGRLLIRNIVMNFDAYLQKQTDQQPRFSRTV